MRDIVSDRDRFLAAKRVALNEKDALLDENHLGEERQHRVRNNLQLVDGMLRKQIEVIPDAVGKDGIAAISRRVIVLAQVYDHLLGNGLSRTIDFGGYLTSLCESFHDLEDIQQRDANL